MLKPVLTLCLFLALTSPTFGQDADGCKDHPMFTRMPNTVIQECSQNYDQTQVPMSAALTKEMEGTKTEINYTYDRESGVPAPSFLQIVKNYENAVKPYKGRRVYYSKDAGLATLSFSSDNKPYWLVLEDRSGGVEGSYVFTLLEMEPMKQEITANGMLDDLNANGSVALYINFETGKSVIESTSRAIVEEIASMLKTNPDLKLMIEGHTDNVGAAQANQKLSGDRASAVMNELIKSGISKVRLQSKGFGADRPIEDNTSEEGRAKNRRVEIVKIP
jgi:OmpA-OmpF porin, OOP family